MIPGEPTRPYNEDILKLLASAEEKAKKEKDWLISTHHILLALLEQPTEFIKKQDFSLEQVYAEINRFVAPSQDEELMLDKLDFSPRAANILTVAKEHAARRGHDVDYDDIFYGIISEPDGIAGQVIRGLGYDLERLAFSYKKAKGLISSQEEMPEKTDDVPVSALMPAQNLEKIAQGLSPADAFSMYDSFATALNIVLNDSACSSEQERLKAAEEWRDYFRDRAKNYSRPPGL